MGIFLPTQQIPPPPFALRLGIAIFAHLSLPIMARDTKIHYQPKPWRKTPLVESANLSKAAGCRIFLKLDLLQPSGSFKSRGIGAFILSTLQQSPNPEKIHFFSSSGGNAGLAAVTASKALGRPCTVVVPNSTKPMMIAKLKAAGASEVVQYGASWKEADTYMRDHVMKSANGGTEAVSVHPFDADETRQGNSTVIEEIDDQLLEMGEGDYGPDVLVAWVAAASLAGLRRRSLRVPLVRTGGLPSSRRRR